MLPADQLELLTAAVDGELTARQSRRLRRLLATSDEARATLARLQADSGRLRDLPKLAPPLDLPERVMAKVAAVTPPTLPCPADRPVAVPFRGRRLPRPATDSGYVASPLLPDPPSIDHVQVRLPFLAPAADLDRDDVRAALADELGRDAACRVDLFVKDPARAVELLQAAARSV